jgi:hypothetical protein
MSAESRESLTRKDVRYQDTAHKKSEVTMEHEAQRQRNSSYACNNAGTVGSGVLCRSIVTPKSVHSASVFASAETRLPSRCLETDCITSLF